MTRISVVLLAVLGGGCMYQSAPVPVVGDSRLLAGEWKGSYSSESGRNGSIVFHLEAGADSARGDVVMIPARSEYARVPTMPEAPRSPRPTNRVLTISFVQCAEGQVSGRLDPYEDPETGERIFTTFDGYLRGNVLKGTFVTLYPESGHRVLGKWEVRRKAFP